MQNDPNQPQQPPSEQPSSEQLPEGSMPAEQILPEGQAFPPYGPPPYGQPPYVPQPAKRSLKWLWITLAVVGAVLILSCGACAALVFSSNGPFSTVTKTVNQGLNSEIAVTQYYQAVQNRNYSQAYSYLDPAATIEGQQITQTTFTQKATQAEAQQGSISNITTKNFQFSPDMRQASVQESVTRKHGTYTVLLNLKNEGGNWKITSASGI